MELRKETNFRVIKQISFAIPCYFYGYFKSPGLKNYPDLNWVNNDYNLIKTKNLDDEICLKIATNLFSLGTKFNLFQNIDYIIMMPLKSTSISSLEKVILQLVKIIEAELGIKITLITDLFLVSDYRKFWENRLSLNERKKEIQAKIKLRENYYHFFDNKKIMIIDDVVSTGTSIAEVVDDLKEFNSTIDIIALAYGSVYQWEKIYT